MKVVGIAAVVVGVGTSSAILFNGPSGGSKSYLSFIRPNNRLFTLQLLSSTARLAVDSKIYIYISLIEVGCFY